jgi:CRISPR-associated protein Cas1
MIKRHLNTVFVTLEDAYLCKDGEALLVRHGHEDKLRVPLLNLDGIVCLGWNISCSPQLMGRCAEAGVLISFLTPHGKFLAAVHGFTSGNVLLRREQYRRADLPAATLAIARNCVAAKIYNCRLVLQRALRDHPGEARGLALAEGVAYLDLRLRGVAHVQDLDTLRGVEGESAAAYFARFNQLLTVDDPALRLDGRSRRPPLDPVNALLSFLYALLAHDVRSACEACGLDPAVGFLHRDRPGRASLALDLMEELRPVFADRLALSLFNRRQLGSGDFDYHEAGAVTLKEKARKGVLVAWQERKQDDLIHPFLQEKISLGLLAHVQARLLARHLRGDIDTYPAFLWR